MSGRVSEATSVAAALEAVRAGCSARVRVLHADGLPPVSLDGQLIRPLVAYAGAAGVVDDALWDAALAVQYAHEASLLHDDVIDRAARRRGAATVAAERGVAAALIEGDHLLTTGYRLAVHGGSIAFATEYARAVERTVAGERMQQSLRGRRLAVDQYRRVVEGKSGELLGAAFGAAALLRGDAAAARFCAAGRRIGVCYQMFDDLLDYLPGADTGKGVLADFRHRIWTWPLALLPSFEWSDDVDAIRAALIAGPGRTPLDRALAILEHEYERTAADVHALVPDDTIVAALLAEWRDRAREAVASATSALHANASTAALKDSTAANASTAPTMSTAANVSTVETAATMWTAANVSTVETAATAALPADADIAAFFARSSRTFSFAARLFPAAERRRIADVYSFCRVTDDLVDGVEAEPDVLEARLDAWLRLCRDGYGGSSTGSAVLDRVLRDAAASGVPFRVIEDLAAGMRMDLRPRRYATIADLRVYTYRVAGVVGVWLTRLWGVHDPDVLDRAADLGHALQLTNILRDVGEDLSRGRCYIPADVLARHGVDVALMREMAAGAPVPPRWSALVEEMMAVADAHYDRAFAAIPSLPRAVRPAVAVAALVYRGIHEEIRRNGYDDITRRACTSLARKVVLAAHALVRLRAEERRRRAPSGVKRRVAAAAGSVMLIAALPAGARAQLTPREQLVQIETRIDTAPSDSLLELERLRALYFVAVDHEPAVADGRASLARLRSRFPALADEHAALLQAYDGALTMLLAKHGTWPWARLRDTKDGLRMLDAAVAAAPDDAEVRYLRLMSCYYLPGLFGRGDSVREDFITLARLLPQQQRTEHEAFTRDVAQFVLEHGPLAEDDRSRLATWVDSHD